MDRDTLIFIAFCVFILLLGVRFWQQLRERTERTEADRSIADEAVPLPAKSRRRYFILIQVIVLGGLLIYMLSWLIRDFKGAEPVLNAGFSLFIYSFPGDVIYSGSVLKGIRRNKKV